MSEPLRKQQLQFDFHDPQEPRSLPKYGYWTLNTKTQSGGLRQRIYKLDQLEFVLKHCNKDVDTYMSQAFFAKQNRRAINVSSITHAFVDLDIYNTDKAHFSRDQMVMAIRIFCEDEGIPAPTMIISSGRGYYLKWMWDNPLPRKLAGVFTAALQRLIYLFQGFGSDSKCRDISRILRVVGTTNSKSGTRAEILHIEEEDGRPISYRFEDFCTEIFEHSFQDIREYREAAQERKKERKQYSPAQIRSFRAWKARKAGLHSNSWLDWHWRVVEDILTLGAMRNQNGLGVPEGQRDIIGHLMGCNLAPVVQPGQLWLELVEHSRMILPSGYIEGELRSHASTLLDRYKAAQEGKTVTYKGRQVSPVYTYSKDRMIELLEIERHEMKSMSALIDTREKYDRKNAKRSKTGLSREDWKETVKAGSAKETKPWEALGISRASYYRKKKSGDL